MRLVPGVLAAVLLTTSRPVFAQTPDPEQPVWSRFFVDANLSGAAASVAAGRQFSSRFVTFGELGTALATYPKPSHSSRFPPADLGGGVMFTRSAAVGVAYSQTTFDGVVALTTTIPDPTFVNTPATAFGNTNEALTRTERAAHVFAAAIVPLPIGDAQLRFAGGPSFFSYRAEMVRAVLYSQTSSQATPQNTITISGIESDVARGTALGFHVSLDFTYFLTTRVGVGTGVRISRATVDIEPEPLSGLGQRIRVGSAAGFVGVRFRFGD
jgi:hypothetical protein